MKVFCGDLDGREIGLAILGRGEYFGELALDHEPRSASVVTLDASRPLVVEPGRFAALLAADPAFATRFIGK